MDIKTSLLQQLDELISCGDKLLATYINEVEAYYSNAPESDFRAYATSAVSAIARIAGKESEYYRSILHDQMKNSLAAPFPGTRPTVFSSIHGSVSALRDAVDKDLLLTLRTQISASIHDDFLEQARDLLTANYHVAAMVLIGGVLEDHLRMLARNRVLPISGTGSISKYNDVLKDTVYIQTVWRRIQSLGDLRNDAAHGNGGNVRPDDVQDALSFTERIIADYPQ
ncbi:MAG: hypothetical protein HY318_07865 [Armatimonadetes bacterium]|nr:hypothetical protein [Armatimonadota bacterium]